jgi:hypothetical protein
MNKVNMSLDDIIKTNKDTRRNSNAGRGRGKPFRRTDGQTRLRSRFGQKEGGRRNSFNNKRTVARRGGPRRYNDFNKNENSNDRGVKVGI